VLAKLGSLLIPGKFAIYIQYNNNKLVFIIALSVMLPFSSLFQVQLVLQSYKPLFLLNELQISYLHLPPAFYLV